MSGLGTEPVEVRTARTMFQRPSWDEYFVAIARVTSSRGNCLRKQVGCVIVVEHRIVAGGYNGPPPGELGCVDGPEHCPCAADPGSRSMGTATVSRELCPALHAEQNAIAFGGRDCRGGTAYLTAEPCHSCAKLLKAAGVVRIVVEGVDWYG